MMETYEQAIVDAGAKLAVMSADRLATTISNKFKAIREKPSKDEICNSYEEIINELVQERAQAIAIAQAYEAELKRFRISDEDIEHLQNTVSDVLDIVGEFSPNADVETFGRFKSLISADTLKSMQVLGFDYRAAIGEPLTEACAKAIESKLTFAPKAAKGQRSQRGRKS